VRPGASAAATFNNTTDRDVGTTRVGPPPSRDRPADSGRDHDAAQLNEFSPRQGCSPYKITYRYTIGTLISEQSWYSKPPKQRFDF